MNRLKYTAIIPLTALLTACGAPEGNFTKSFQELGGQVDEGHYGVPNNHNIAEQSISGHQGMVANLTRKFDQDTDARVNFAFGSAALDAGARSALQRQAAWIKAHPAVTYRVFGHTDKVGSVASNKQLGLRRARAVVRYLTAQGIPKSKLQALASFGETRPLVLTEGPERQNRRTVTEISGFARKHSGPDLDGKYAHRIYNAYISGGNGANATAAQ